MLEKIPNHKEIAVFLKILVIVMSPRAIIAVANIYWRKSFTIYFN